MEFHISCTAKVRRKAPVPSPTRAVWSSDRMMQLKRAPTLGSSLHPNCGAAKVMLLRVERFWEGSRSKEEGWELNEEGQGS